ncbi:hypothetical protein R1sor_020233 [Riccia sorocarpa]|uniref:FCP1 homology domain-containing protein n=1 Tax=Riccia sorocarpa TaxID=122646 RepID=A0ABD3IFX0_9MARC
MSSAWPCAGPLVYCGSAQSRSESCGSEQSRRHLTGPRAIVPAPKPVATANLPSTSQRAGKKRVQEGSAGSPPKRKKPAVQPPPKPAVPKARSKVKAPKRVKRERAESVEAVNEVEVVEKKKSSEGPWLIKRYFKVDVISNVQWAYMKSVDISAAFVGISEFEQRRLGLRGVITCQYVPPNVPLCKEWLLSFDGAPKRDCSATVQGQRIIFTEELFREAFFIQEELNPPDLNNRFLNMSCGLVWRTGSRVTMRRRSDIWRRTAYMKFGDPSFNPSPEEDLNDDTQVILHEDVGSSKRRVAAPNRAADVTRRCASRAHARGPERGRKSPSRHFAWAASPGGRAQGLAAPRRAAIALCGPARGLNGFAALRRAASTSVNASSDIFLRGQNLTQINFLFFVVLAPLRRPDVLEPEMQQRLLHSLQTEDQMDVRLNAMKAELVELERLVAEERCLLEETAHRRKEEERRLEELGANVYRPRLVDPRAVQRKTLILAFDGLLVSIRTSAEEHSEASQHGWDVLQVKKGCFVVVRTSLSEFLQACIHKFHLMIWTSRPRAVIDCILRFLFKSKKISFDLAHHEDCIVWSREQCFTFGSKTSRPVTCKDFDILYEHNICARDVLIVDNDVAKISTNNVMNALVPRRWDLSVETPSSSFLMDHLLPFLTTWRSSVKGTVDFVEETRPWATLPWVEEPVETLVKWWSPDVKKTKTWTDVLFRSCTYEERKNLRLIWTGIIVRQESRVESVTSVEGATPVESTTLVLSAAPAAIEQPSAPISSCRCSVCSIYQLVVTHSRFQLCMTYFVYTCRAHIIDFFFHIDFEFCDVKGW